MSELFSDVNWLAVAISTVISFMLGGLWYSKAMFGEKWAQGVGVPFGPEAKQPIPALVMQLSGTVLLSLFIGIAFAQGIVALGIFGALTAGVLLMAGSLFALHSTYATLAQGGFVLVMAIIMFGCQWLLS